MRGLRLRHFASSLSIVADRRRMAGRSPDGEKQQRLGGWACGAIDQAIYSLTNFALAILVARAGTLEEFGAFSIIFVAYLLAAGVVEAVTGETFTVVHSASDRSAVAVPLAEAAGCALGLGVIFGAVGAAIGVLTNGPTATVLPVFALVLPGLLLQNVWRFAFFATARPMGAVRNDLVWGIGQATAILVLIANGHQSLNALVLAWGGAAALAAGFGMVQTGVLPRPLRAGRWLTRHGSLSVRFAGEFLILSGSGYLVQAILGAISGLAEAAKLRAALVVMAPLLALLNAVRIAVMPLAVRLRRSEGNGLGRLVGRISGGLTVVAAAWCAAAVGAPDQVGRALLGDSWTGARQVVPAAGALIVAMSIGFGPIIGLRAIAAARRSLRPRAGVAVMQLVFGIAGAVLGDAVGAAVGLAMANGVGIVLLWYQFRRAYFDDDAGKASETVSTDTELTLPL